jgi:hypothetical protein
LLNRVNAGSVVSVRGEQHRARWPQVLPAAGAAALLGCVGLLALGLAGAASFETVPDRSPAQLLPASLAAGPDFHVVDPVHGDGLMHLFLLESRFGRFAAYGRVALELRVREIHALTELAKTSDVEILAGGVGHGIASEVGTAVGVVSHPVGTLTGIPRGISHLFHGYTAQGQEALADARRAANSSGTGSGSSARSELNKGGDAARGYAERYLGVSAAERAWYKRLGVSPYTDNRVLRVAIRKAAKTEAVGRFGVKFAGVPAIPGLELTQRAVDAIYNEDPAAVRARTRKTLAAYGLSPSEIETWLNAPLLNPARQVVLLETARQLEGVAGRGELFRHSLGLISNEEVEVYLLSANLLLQAQRSHPLASIAGGVRLPSAELAGGGVAVCGAFEAVYWTEDVAHGEAQLRAALPATPPGAHRELWLTGTISERARAELRERNWELHEVAPDSPAH